MAIPVVILESFTKTIISDEIGFTKSHVNFRVDTPFTLWEARASNNTQTPDIGVGVIVGNDMILGEQILGNLDTKTLGELDNLILAEVAFVGNDMILGEQILGNLETKTLGELDNLTLAEVAFDSNSFVGSFDVDYTELLSGDGDYVISIYVQSGGVWYG